MMRKIAEELTSVQPINIKFPKGFWTKPWCLIIKKRRGREDGKSNL